MFKSTLKCLILHIFRFYPKTKISNVIKLLTAINFSKFWVHSIEIAFLFIS